MDDIYIYTYINIYIWMDGWMDRWMDFVFFFIIVCKDFTLVFLLLHIYIKLW